MIRPKSYTDNFFSFHLNESLSSAQNVIPVVLEFIKPESVIDIGCGIGTWLSIWKQHNAEHVLGVDGDYVNKTELLIDPKEFVAFDLANGYKSEKKFDLVSSLEVAEHIDQKFSGVFISSLCSLGDVILFSAAIPGQEGTLHINEQYPSYWVKLFRDNGFIPVDCIRPLIWDNENISWWYRQNIMFFLREDQKHKYVNFSSIKMRGPNSYVHPELFNYKLDKIAAYENILRTPMSIARYLVHRLLKRRKQK